MKSIRILIKTEPVAKARARTIYQNGSIRTYTPTKTVNAESFLKARLLRHKDNAFPPHIPVKLSVSFFRSKSKWLPRKETMPFRKADLDNYTKLVCDALNGVLIPDDAQITTIITRKRWSNNGQGYITIRLEEDSL